MTASFRTATTRIATAACAFALSLAMISATVAVPHQTVAPVSIEAFVA